VNNIWEYAPGSAYPQEQSMAGFSVEASDGVIGRVDRQRDEPGMQHLVVDTGVWVFGKSVLIPAGTVTRVDTDTQVVTVARSRDEIKAAPQFATDSETTDPAYLLAVADYYRSLGLRAAP
jgi:hypothetical protein